MNPVRRWRVRRKMKRIERLSASAADQIAAFPTRQLRRQAERDWDKAMKPRSERSH